MPNIELLEKSTPVAPVRIAALAGCQDLANEVDKKLVKFRKELVAKKKPSQIPQGYMSGVSQQPDAQDVEACRPPHQPRQQKQCFFFYHGKFLLIMNIVHFMCKTGRGFPRPSQW